MHQQATDATEAVLARLVDFHIADTDTTTALIAFGEQAELSVLISQDARDASTTGLIGTFPIAEALERLLEGTGLEHWMEGPAVVISRRVAEVHVASDAAPDDEGRGQSDGRSPLAALVRWSVRALAAVVAAGGTPALAEAHDQTDTVDVIEEIVVTGLRRESTVQEAPAAISAIGAGELQDRGIVSPDDLKFAVPSMNFTQLGYGANISIRGIGAFNGQPGVALTTDGIYQSRDSSAQLSTLDLARIEVLRGPQGTLYGRNSVGGVVNYITAAPSQDPNGHVRLGLSEYEEWTMEGAYGAPISANTRFRAAFSVADKGEGFTRNLSAGALRARRGRTPSLPAQGGLRPARCAQCRPHARHDYYRRGSSTIRVVGGRPPGQRHPEPRRSPHHSPPQGLPDGGSILRAQPDRAGVPRRRADAEPGNTSWNHQERHGPTRNTISRHGRTGTPSSSTTPARPAQTTPRPLPRS